MTKKQIPTDIEERIRDLEKQIEDQKQTIEEMKNKNDAENILFNAQTDTAMLLDSEGKVLAINESAAKRINKSVEDIIGSNIAHGLGPDIIKERKKKHLEVIKYGKPLHFQDERNGRIYRNSFYPVPDNKGGRTVLAIYSRDVTESVKVEKALKEEIAHRRMLFENSRDGIVVLDINGKVYEANKKYADMLGYSLEEVMDLHVWDWDPQWTKKLLQRVFELDNGSGRLFETRHKRKDGSYYDVEISVNLITIEGDKFSFNVCRDITERKRDDDALKEAYNIINRSPVVAFLWHTLERMPVKYVSDNVEKLFGYKAEDFTSGDVLFGDLIYPDDRERVKKEIDINKYDKSVKEFVHKPYRIVDKNGVIKWVDNMTFVRRDDDGNATSFQGIVIDITNRIEAEEERKSMEQRLQQAQKMEAIGMLAGGVAHDLNNILSAVVSYPELILMDLPEESHLIKPILTIKKAGERAAVVVQDLLTLARRGVSINKVVDFNQIISEQLKSPECENLLMINKGVKIDLELSDDLFKIKGSSAHLSKTITNLITNAVEAMPSGGIITVKSENQHVDRSIKGYDDIKEGDYVVVAISDTGTGISDEDMKSIFEPFYTRKVMGRSGTGLGMSVVWNTVKDHKGYIDIKSAEGVGSTFILYFPITKEEIIASDERIPLDEYIGHGESILVVDDIEEQRELASMILTKIGYSVHAVAGGEEAVEYLKKKNADLIVLDMIMDPGIDGLDTYKKIIEFKSKQKAIIVSGYSETDRVKEIERLGGGQYIKKPYSMEKIGIAVKKELERE